MDISNTNFTSAKQTNIKSSGQNFTTDMKSNSVVSDHPFTNPKHHKYSTFHVNITIRHFDASTCKSLFDVFKQAKQKQADGMKVKVEWMYHSFDKRILELGEDFSNLFNIRFLFVSKNRRARY